jgi:hypothetical protein
MQVLEILGKKENVTLRIDMTGDRAEQKKWDREYMREKAQKKCVVWIPLPKLGPGSCRFEGQSNTKKDRNIGNASICAFILKYASALELKRSFCSLTLWPRACRRSALKATLATLATRTLFADAADTCISKKSRKRMQSDHMRF